MRRQQTKLNVEIGSLADLFGKAKLRAPTEFLRDVLGRLEVDAAQLDRQVRAPARRGAAARGRRERHRGGPAGPVRGAGPDVVERHVRRGPRARPTSPSARRWTSRWPRRPARRRSARRSASASRSWRLLLCLWIAYHTANVDHPAAAGNRGRAAGHRRRRGRPDAPREPEHRRRAGRNGAVVQPVHGQAGIAHRPGREEHAGRGGLVREPLFGEPSDGRRGGGNLGAGQRRGGGGGAGDAQPADGGGGDRGDERQHRRDLEERERGRRRRGDGRGAGAGRQRDDEPPGRGERRNRRGRQGRSTRSRSRRSCWR